MLPIRWSLLFLYKDTVRLDIVISSTLKCVSIFCKNSNKVLLHRRGEAKLKFKWKIIYSQLAQVQRKWSGKKLQLVLRQWKLDLINFSKNHCQKDRSMNSLAGQYYLWRSPLRCWVGPRSSCLARMRKTASSMYVNSRLIRRHHLRGLLHPVNDIIF